MQELEITIENEDRVQIHVNGVNVKNVSRCQKKNVKMSWGMCRNDPFPRTIMSSRSRFHTTGTTDYGKNTRKKSFKHFMHLTGQQKFSKIKIRSPGENATPPPIPSRMKCFVRIFARCPGLFIRPLTVRSAISSAELQFCDVITPLDVV